MIKKIFKFLPIVFCLSIATLIFADTSKISDQDIAKKVNEKIGSGWFSNGYDKVNFQVKNGIVKLSGYVKTTDDKEKIERDVRNINGVVNVESKIYVEEPNVKETRNFPKDSYGTSLDEQLNKKIRDNVNRGWFWDSYKDVSLNTINGVVTLEGLVKDIKDQQKIMTEVQKIKGVKGVKSNLRIQNKEEGNE